MLVLAPARVGLSVIPSRALGSDDLRHYGRGVDLIVPLCRHCESGPIALLASSAIVS
jgi:hypothetical protein